MAFELKLHPEHKILEVTCWDTLTMAEIKDMDAQILQTLDASEDKLHLFTDVHQVTEHPNNLAQVWQITKPIADSPNLDHWYVYMSRNPITQFLIDTISYLGKFRVYLVKNRDEVFKPSTD